VYVMEGSAGDMTDETCSFANFLRNFRSFFENFISNFYLKNIF